MKLLNLICSGSFLGFWYKPGSCSAVLVFDRSSRGSGSVSQNETASNIHSFKKTNRIFKFLLTSITFSFRIWIALGHTAATVTTICFGSQKDKILGIIYLIVFYTILFTKQRAIINTAMMFEYSN